MPANNGAEIKTQIGSYCQQKLAYFKDMKHLMEAEHAAIEALNLEELDRAINQKETLRAEVDRLDERQRSSDTRSSLTDYERDILFESIKELSRMEGENQRLLLSKKESIRLELKAMSTKKSALRAYNGPHNSGNTLSESY